MAIIFGQIYLACIFSVEIVGRKIVKNIPIIMAKIDWKESVRSTRATGASMYAKAKARLPRIYKNSLATPRDITTLELLRMADKKLSR